ncbi:response regulator [Leptolyngbya sp. BC1307]|uniref:sensor histidine kinase n=1 Tax=Leptolyngbya sp. BC1307 TaxID=2029589 RepID=UPI000EFCEF26|nr:response regulator [Leptolyngbya sp. BC1307]
MYCTLQPFILLVDDNPNNLSVLSQTLKTAGYKIRMAVDGEDALSQVARARPELILLDVQMPKIDGFETCRRLQANPETEGIPVIFMTALSDAGNKVKGLSLGAVDYITKPFEYEEVLARVRVHWRLKQLTEALEQQVAERSQALQQAQVQLVQREKLSALGEIVAGVAHEINNPVGCVVGNISAVQTYFDDLLQIIDLYSAAFPQPGPAIEAAIEEIDLDYIRDDLPKMITAMRDGGDRIKTISRSLRNFSRADTDIPQPFDLHEGLDSTLLILRHRLKANGSRPDIEIVTDYGELPLVQCFPGQLNQVFMNILANAIDALDDASQGRSLAEREASPSRITLRTRVENEQVKVAITDNGPGIPESVRARIFDHLFTTKGVGKGTGLGLAITHQIIVEKHSGTIEVASTPSSGTEFILMLPIASKADADE